MVTSGDETFGMLLKTFRGRRQLKQDALAYKIGKKNRGSIDAWERCLYRPKYRETVLALAQVLQLSERETNQLLAAANFPPEYQIPESEEGRNLEDLKRRYLAWLQDQYEYMDLGGISPRVASRGGARTVKIRIADIFIPIRVKSESSFIRHIVPFSIAGNDEPENLVLDVDAADVSTDVILSTADDQQVFVQFKYGGSSKERIAANQVIDEIDVPFLPIKAVPSLGREGAIESFKRWKTSSKQDSLTLAKLLEHRRVVVLGHPGTGKTTLGKYLSYALAIGNTTLIGDNLKGYIPLLVRAADYAKALKRDESLSFYRYLTETYYSDHFGPLLAWALEHNQCLVIIDGLDEIPDPILRGQATRKIDQFVSEYRENYFIVSSRIVGYRENQLTGHFIHVQMAEWGEQQIVAYLERWYQAISEKPSSTIHAASKEQAQQLWKTIKKREGVRQLAGTPLLLMIMALIDQYGGKLPERRVELYQLATETLLSHWPFHHREQQIDFREMLEILEPIAYHIFTANEDRLITEYEFRPLFEEQVRQVLGTNPRQTRVRSMQILRTIEEHTGFLLKRGTNEHGQELYGFLHPTFAEYLTARYFAGRWEKERVLEIADRIHEPTWHEVVLLMAGHLGTLMPVQATRLLEYIEKLPDPFEGQLHRNLLLAAEIIGDGVSVERYKRDEVISQLITIAQETAFEPLWESSIARLSRIARVSPLPRLPDLLKQREKDSMGVRVRKVLLARAMGFQRETDIASLVQGLFADEMTRELAVGSLHLEFSRSVRKQRACTYTCSIRYTTKGFRVVSGIELSKQAAEGLRKLPLPIQDDLETMDIAPPATPVEIWIIDQQQLLRLSSQRLAQLLTTCQKHMPWRATILGEEIRHAYRLHALLQEWITQAWRATNREERILTLNALLQIVSSPRRRGMIAKEREWDELPAWRRVLRTMASEDKDPQTRSMALLVALSLSLDLKEERDLIMEGLCDQAYEVRATAAREARGLLWSAHPRDEIVSLLLNKLWELTTDSSSEVRLSCARALLSAYRSMLQAPEDSLPLSRLVDLFCTLPLERLTAREAIQQIFDLMRLVYQTNAPAAIEAIGNRLAALIEQMAMAAEDIKEIVVRTVQSGRLPIAGQEQLARRLSPFLQHTEPRIRRLTVAIWAAYLRDLPETLPIIPLLQDYDVRVRSAAFEALGNTDLAKPAVQDILLHALRNDEPRVKLAILRRIGENSRRILASARSLLLHPVLYQPKVVDGLLYLLSEERLQVAIETASLLTRVQDPALREKIIDVVNAKASENLAALSVLWGLMAPLVDA